MSWQLRWSPPAIRSLEKLHWAQAARIDRAVQDLVRTGEGEVFRLRADDPITARLRVPPTSSASAPTRVTASSGSGSSTWPERVALRSSDHPTAQGP